MVKTD